MCLFGNGVDGMFAVPNNLFYSLTQIVLSRSDNHVKHIGFRLFVRSTFDSRA